MASHYDILKVAFDAPDAVVRAAYRALAARHHPDRHDAASDAAQQMQRINEAYRVLSDADQRPLYDAQLRQQRRRRAEDNRAVAESTAAATPAPKPVAIPSPVPAPLRQRAAALYAAHAALR